MQRVRHLLEGNELFRKSHFQQNKDRLLKLAQHGQNPKILFIGCADSRVIPSMITSAAPGDLFVLRNVGNFVAPYKPSDDYHATAAGIEYAVNALGVSDIIVCGHTRCGAIAAVLNGVGPNKSQFVHARTWLTLGERAKRMALTALGRDADRGELLTLTEQLSVVTQLDHLITYPYVNDGVVEGRLHLHGWMYDIETGAIRYYDPGEQQFRPSEDLRSKGAAT